MSSLTEYFSNSVKPFISWSRYKRDLSLFTIFSSENILNIQEKCDIDFPMSWIRERVNKLFNDSSSLIEGDSLFELKAKSLLPQNEDVDWIDEIQLIKDKDLAFARLLQFKAFSEVGIALASRIRENEMSISAFKYYQTLDLFSKPDIEITIDKKIFQETAEEVFIRYKSIKGFDHIEYDLPDIDEAINSLLSSVDKRLNTSFEELASEVETSEQAVAIFLALLEAIRWGFVKAEQVNNNELIKIEKNYEE